MQVFIELKCRETNRKRQALRCYSFYSIFCTTFQKVLIYSRVGVFVFAGAEGKVDESMELMKEVEDLKQKKRMAEVGRDMVICFIQGYISCTLHVQCNVKKVFPIARPDLRVVVVCS